MAPKHGIIHLDEVYFCFDLNVEGYRLFVHVMNHPTAKDMCHQRETATDNCFVVTPLKKHAFALHSRGLGVSLMYS